MKYDLCQNYPSVPDAQSDFMEEWRKQIARYMCKGNRRHTNAQKQSLLSPFPSLSPFASVKYLQ